MSFASYDEKITRISIKVKAGGWDRHMYTGNEIRGKKVGLVGLGHVGHSRC